jgi:hypothetical protein
MLKLVRQDSDALFCPSLQIGYPLARAIRYNQFIKIDIGFHCWPNSEVGYVESSDALCVGPSICSGLHTAQDVSTDTTIKIVGLFKVC